MNTREQVLKVAAQLDSRDADGWLSDELRNMAAQLRAAVAVEPIEGEREAVAWLIEFPGGNGQPNNRFVYLHNAVGDYRDIHPAATSTPLYKALK